MCKQCGCGYEWYDDIETGAPGAMVGEEKPGEKEEY